MAKVALAFSGGLDTLICIDYLKRRKNLQVITFSGNVGQGEYIEPIGEKSIELGTSASHLEDLRPEFAEEFILPAIRARARYGHEYYLGSALARPLIARELVNIAREEGCEYLAHGCRGKGNDRIRFERCFEQLAPELTVISPLTELGVNHPGEDIDYARRTSLPLDSSTETIFNVEQNLWGANVQLTPFIDEWEEAPNETYIVTERPENTPDRKIELELRFRKGKPVALDGDEQPLHEIIQTLGKMGGTFGVGRTDVVEDSLEDEKTRQVYEQPAATIIHRAYKALEELVQNREVVEMKRSLERSYGKLVYHGKWFSNERKGLDQFFRQVNSSMSGTVRLRLFKGQVRVLGRKAKNHHLPEGDEDLDLEALKEQIKDSDSSSHY